MIALILITFCCGLAAFFLLQNSIASINNIPLYGWPGKILKICLTVIVTILIFIGTTSMFIVSVAMAMGGVKK